MALRTLEALKSYFFEHAYPTWQQFHDVLDSLRHKSDKVPIADVDGLTEQLNGRVTNSQLNDEIQARTDADTAILGNVTDETDARITADATLQAAIDDARSIAEGRSKGRVFDTVNDMNSWLAVSTNTASLNIGDNLLIKALDVPDYWWDGTCAQKLEIEKVDLIDYVQKERKINGHNLSADVNLTANDIGLGNVNNTADMDKPISTAVQTALDNIKGIGGTSYLYVAGKGTAVENATELQAAYDKAKTMKPYGSALSSTNRVALVVGSGTYTFAAPFAVNTQFVDIVSLTGIPDVFLNGINVTENDVLLRGINCGAAAFTIASNLYLLKCEYCTGGNNSFGYATTTTLYVTGTFNYCTAGNNSFGGGVTKAAQANGTFNYCTAGDNSFGGGYNGAAGGTFNFCTAGGNSFGAGTAGFVNSAVGKFNNCLAAANSFGGGTSGGIAYGTFYNCVSGENSFGAYKISNTARIYNCRITSGTFKTPEAGGRIILCIDGSNNVITI